jgi:LacI family transcriptional regulator
MMKKKTSKVSLGDVAKAAGVSKTSVACALRNIPGVSKETRRRVLRIAHRLNYFPDARLTARMVGIRHATTKDLLPIIWLNTNREKNAWHEQRFLSPYREGAEERCRELGYRIEEIWTREPGLTMRRIAQIIDHQGIAGVIATDPARHIRLQWDRLAGVSIGGGLLAPALHRITMDSNFNLGLALKFLKRFGYRRIGVCLTEEADRFSRHDARSVALYFNSTLPKSRRVEPLFTPYFMKPSEDTPTVAAWLKRERPDAIVGCSSRLVKWARYAGYRVPEDIGVVHVAIEDDVSDWAGIYANKREVGRLAAEKLVSLIQNGQFGIPAIASSTLVPGSWRAGCTLLIPKPRKIEDPTNEANYSSTLRQGFPTAAGHRDE